MHNVYRNNLTAAALLFVIISFLACKKNGKNELQNLQPADSTQQINKWILDSMRQYYYWNEQAQNNHNLSGQPIDFFQNLLHPIDKFSRISDQGQAQQPLTTQMMYGFHYIIITEPSFSSTNFLGIILFVSKGSNAEAVGLRRGLYFSSVNDVPITASSLSSINNLLVSGNPVQLKMVRYNPTGTWTANGTKQVIKTYFENRPVYKTLLLENAGLKTGYIFYNSFNEAFDYDLLAAFDKLKQHSVKELIIDLRYNAGGSVASAAKLCALIANVQPGDVFGIYKGNSNYSSVHQTFSKAISSSTSGAGADFDDIRNRRLSINRVFILTTKNTVSAAEMVVNNLKPYINVVHIGEKTYGKDMASTIIKDLRNPKKVFWTIYPLVYKIYNANNTGEYGQGIAPAYQINELAQIPLPVLGNPGDPLLKKATEIIYNTNALSVSELKQNGLRPADREPGDDFLPVKAIDKIHYHSIEVFSKNGAEIIVLHQQ